MKDNAFPIIGIGASAGGLSALEAFFTALPSNREPNMTFVVVQHLDPNHKSLLGEILSKHTKLPIVEAINGIAVQANCIYTLPPHQEMTYKDGSLWIHEPKLPHGQNHPIDIFLSSLAENLLDASVGVILSGMGSDGTLGIQAIANTAGLTFAQTPETAEYDSMPSSAIATGIIDHILPPDAIASKLFAIREEEGLQVDPPLETQDSSAVQIMKTILSILRSQTGHDFSQYKPSSINRRLEHRIAVCRIRTLEDYLNYLQKEPQEIHLLFSDLLIGVTSFFRDPSTFQYLEDQVIPSILSQKKDSETIRIWCPGCSTGEEPYSLAILFQECMSKTKQRINIQIFATDIDHRAISIARTGTYALNISDRMSPERLSRYFTKEPDGKSYRILKSLRDSLIFSEQDIALDPPFSKLDMISCRNLLIYMEISLQKKLLSIFHYALNPDGLLLLGPSESVGTFESLFDVINVNLKIFRATNQKQNSPAQSHPLDAPKTPFLLHQTIGTHNMPETSMQASLEDMRSINEELQSSNEELETSKEELQAINEELTTVNAELQSKVAELSQVNNDMNNLLAGTGIGTLFVDQQLSILRYTPATCTIINLIRTDVGRPLWHLVTNLRNYSQMVPDVQSVLDSLIPKELEVESLDGRWYTMRMQPYRTLDNVVEGAVVTFVDISDKKRLQEELEIAQQQLRIASHDSIPGIPIQPGPHP